jgi:hypothetical protein
MSLEAEEDSNNEILATTLSIGNIMEIIICCQLI